MPVALLRGENFRLYPRLEIQPRPGLNLITGSNAAGKTSLLEAWFVAARGRSFRAQNLAELCGTDRVDWNVFLEAEHDEYRNRIGLGWTKQGAEVRLDEVRNARISDVVRLLPMQLIDPLAHRLLEEGPAYRRSFIDWGVFHVEHSFLDVWRRYQRALKQRNTALRDDLEDRAVQAWNEELAVTGEALNQMRKAHIKATAPGLSIWASRLLETDDVTCEWQQGWSEEEPFQEVLDRGLEQHRRMRSTVQGPHRADVFSKIL